jgi:hypothetical protein
MRLDNTLRQVLTAIVLAGCSMWANPAAGQTTGQAHAVVVVGRDADFRFTGVAGGGSVVLRHRVGLDGEFGLLVDNSDERTLSPWLSGGASVRFLSDRKTTPFVGGGLARFGDLAGLYVDAGANYWFAGHVALRVALRTSFLSKSCPAGFTACEGGTTWFVHGGLTFGKR